MKELNNILSGVDKSWREILERSLLSLDKAYLKFLLEGKGYFPDRANFLNAFKTLKKEDTRYILFGQDPYPRKPSATGYAFIDGAIESIFDDSGLTKSVNRATSLRNFVKMLLVCEGKLKNDFNKNALKKIDKSKLCNSIDRLRKNFENNGVLLLNRALIFTKKEDSRYHLKQWSSFVETFLLMIEDEIVLILFGEAAKDISKLESTKRFKKHIFEHPYNISFITNKEVHKLFKPMNLLM